MTYRLLCWLDSCRGYASCWVVESLFPCPNRTRDWPCRNWLEDPCLCLRPILPDRFLFLFIGLCPLKVMKRRPAISSSRRDGTNKKGGKKKHFPPSLHCLNISVSRIVPLGLLKCVWAFASMIHSQHLPFLFPCCAWTLVVSPYRHPTAVSFLSWTPAART